MAALCLAVRTASIREDKMNAETVLAAIATVLLLVYLFYSLLRPEKF